MSASQADTEKPSASWPTLLLLLAIAVLIVLSFASLDLKWSAFAEPDALARMADFLQGFSPPETSSPFMLKVAMATLQTIAISLIGTLAAVFAGMVLALPASSRSRTARYPARALLNFFRAVPELVWAAIFVIAVGLGPFAGTLALAAHTTGVLGRLFADTLENVPPAAATALRVNGAGGAARFFYATLPEALPQFVSYSLYRWENNIRAATILGVVGAGGLGQMLFYYLSLFQMQRAATVILAMILIVLLVDRLSYQARKWLAA